MTQAIDRESYAPAGAVRERRFPTLNALRAVGAILVVLTHSAFNTGRINQGWTGAMLARFDFGVTLFFILSGFLLSRPWFMAAALGEHPPSARHYLWKRALRILPLYWIVILVALWIDPANADLGAGAWITNLTLTQLYDPALLPSSATQMWSLCTEAAFYVLLPLLCWLLVGRTRRLSMRRVLLGAGGLALVGLVWQVVVAQIPGREGHFAQWLPGYLPWFVVGIVYAASSAQLTVTPDQAPLGRVLDRLGADLTGCWILALAVFAVAWSPIAGPRLLLTPGAWEAGAKLALYTVAGAFFVLPLVFGPERDGWIRERLSGPVPLWLGDISYGIFAIHLLVLNLVFHLLDLEVFHGRFLTVASLTLSITVVFATASFYLVERPIMRAKNIRFFSRMEPHDLTVPAPPEIAP